MTTVEVCETFVSIQGESTYAGLPCFFVRLSGCNLRCRYCDTTHAYGPGRPMTVDALVEECRRSGLPLAEITGGEPLLQPGFPDLARALRDRTKATVLVETNGSRDIAVIPENVVCILDVKSPGSGENGKMDLANLDRLRPYDEVKFVLTGRADYEWARQFVRDRDMASRCRAVLFSPAHKQLAPSDLGRWILEDRLPVRLQIQLHKVLGLR